MTAVIAALGVAASTRAAAQTTQLSITAQGTIPSSCSIAVATAFGTPNLTASGSVGATATVNCNQGFRVNATSLNGGLKNSKTAAGFASLVAYNLTVAVPLDAPAATVSATCAATTLVAAQAGCALSPNNTTGLSSGGKASLGKTATLTFAYTVPALPTRLIAGTFTDTITLSITPVP